MKKKLLTLMLMVASIFALSSCADVYSQPIINDEPNVNIIIQYGTPYYINGYRYYLYNGWYYRSYFHNNRHYMYKHHRQPRHIHDNRIIPPKHHYNPNHKPNNYIPNNHKPNNYRPNNKPNNNNNRNTNRNFGGRR